MGDEGADEAVDVLVRRLEFLRELGSEPTEQRALPRQLGTSRSTVDRALRELEAAGWVTRADGGYVRTLAGRLVVDAFEEFAATYDALTELRPALEALDPGPEIPPVVLRTADHAAVASETTPRERLDSVRTYVEDSAALRGALPALLDDRLLDSLSEAAPQANAARLVLPASVTRPGERAHADISRVTGNDAVEVYLEADAPRLGVLVATFPERAAPSVLVTVHGDEGDLRCLVETTADAAVEWALDALAARERAATAYTSTSASLLPDALRRSTRDETGAADADADAAAGANADTDADVLPDALAREGFVALTESYFETRTPAPPATTLRTGAELVDVEAGRTLDREFVDEGERTRLATALRETLRDGEHVAVLGPAASGKSTTCKTVAVDWHERGLGQVFYRASDAGTSFSSVEALRERVADAEGTPLVVVEDATRPTAAAVFDLVADPPDGDLRVLVDARRDEWFDPPAGPETSYGEVRHRFRTRRMPSLDDRERERLYEHVDGLVEASLPDYEDFAAVLPENGDGAESEDVNATENSDGSADGGGNDDAESPGELLSVLHHLGRYAGDEDVDVSGEHREPTTLVETVQAVHGALADDAAPGARIVGVHVAALVAAGVEPTRGLVYALAASPDGPDAPAVEDALDVLEGVMLFESGSGYERVHETWAVQFLETACARDGDARARSQFATAVGAVFELVDSAERRAVVRALAGGDAPTVDAIADDPAAWASSFVERLYGVGRERSQLAVLFGDGEREPFALPDACSTRDRLRAVQWRGEMLLTAGDFEAAVEALDRLADLADDHDERWFLARSRERRGYARERLGEFEAARTLIERARSDYEAIDDTKGRAECLNGLGVLAWLEGDVETASDHLEAASEAYAEAGDRKGRADCLNNRGIVARERGDLDAAETYWRRSYELRREIGDHHNVVDTLVNLGVAARERGDLEDALQRFRQAVERARDFGGREYEAHSLRALANTLVRRGREDDLETALAQLERALELDREAGVRFAEGHVHCSLASAHRKRGDLDAAREHLDAAADAYADAGDETDHADVAAERGRVALADGDPETAVEYLSESVATLEDADRAPGLADVRESLGRALVATGDYDAAREQLTAAVETFESRGAQRYAAPVRELLEALDENADAARAEVGPPES